MWDDWDWSGAEREFKRAFELNPESDRGGFCIASWKRWEGLMKPSPMLGLIGMNQGIRVQEGRAWQTSLQRRTL